MYPRIELEDEAYAVQATAYALLVYKEQEPENTTCTLFTLPFILFSFCILEFIPGEKCQSQFT